MTTTWNPAQYLRYADDRERPFWDLVARIPVSEPRRVVDLGCGPGTATARLAQRWPEARIHGIDSSPAMIGQAQSRAQPGRLSFEQTDVAAWQPEPHSVEVILSNATLHWVPDHTELFVLWLDALTPGGALAVQVPGNWNAPSHTALRALAASPAWRERLAGAAESVQVHTPADYYARLRARGARVDLWESTYYHVLSGPDPVLEWVRGSALGPYLARLSPEEAAQFTADYGALMREAYPASSDASTLFPFRRVFFVATVAG